MIDRRRLIPHWKRVFMSRFFLVTDETLFVRWYQRFLCFWTFLFFLPRLPHAQELYGRTYLRSSIPVWKWIGDPILPLWLIHLLFFLLALGLAAFAFGYMMRLAHVLILIILSLLFAQDMVMPRAYGVLAYIQWFLLFLAPYDDMGVRPDNPGRSASWQTFLLRLQFTSVYFFTVIAKLAAGQGWLTGETLYRILNSPRYGLWLLSQWGVSRELCISLSVGTLAMEWFVAFGLWFEKTRKLAILVCVFLHLSMALTLRVSVLFHLLMIGHLLLFASSKSRHTKPLYPSDQARPSKQG